MKKTIVLSLVLTFLIAGVASAEISKEKDSFSGEKITKSVGVINRIQNVVFAKFESKNETLYLLKVNQKFVLPIRPFVDRNGLIKLNENLDQIYVLPIRRTDMDYDVASATYTVSLPVVNEIAITDKPITLRVYHPFFINEELTIVIPYKIVEEWKAIINIVE